MLANPKVRSVHSILIDWCFSDCNGGSILDKNIFFGFFFPLKYSKNKMNSTLRPTHLYRYLKTVQLDLFYIFYLNFHLSPSDGLWLNVPLAYWLWVVIFFNWSYCLLMNGFRKLEMIVLHSLRKIFAFASIQVQNLCSSFWPGLKLIFSVRLIAVVWDWF